jgi:hypothetical protein
MKTTFRLASALALVLALAAAPAIAATFTTGDYKGTTSQKDAAGHKRKLSFHADATNFKLTKLAFKETGLCNDGKTSFGSQHGLHASIGPKGKFSIDAHTASQATHITVSGTIAGTSASGHFKIITNFNQSGKPDPNGKSHCSTGTVNWSAKKS